MLLFRLFAWWFRLKGWRTAELIPARVQKCVIIAAPHTSNWDFVYSLGGAYLMGVQPRYLAKKELFRFPLSFVMRATGGIPVIRNRNTRLVDAIIALFQQHSELKLMIPAEGTRKRVQQWKSGFYHVALGAGVPVYLAYLDYEKKVAGFGKEVILSGDKEQDAAVIRDFYKDKKGRYPALFNLDAIRFD